MPSHVKLTIVKSGYIFEETTVTLLEYDEESKTLEKNMFFAETWQRAFVDSASSPTESKKFSVLLHQGENGLYLFARVLLLFSIDSLFVQDIE